MRIIHVPIVLALLLAGLACLSLVSGQETKAPAAESLESLRGRAEKGDIDAQSTLGTVYFSGGLGLFVVTQDYKEAARWYRKAADQGDASAQGMLGIMYDAGQGVPQDYKEAGKWLRLAAEQGDAFDQYKVGVRYFRGQGVTQDYKEALRWYRKAAERGYTPAQWQLAMMYYDGEGVPQDYVEAHMWVNIAASLTSGSPVKMYIDQREVVAKKMTPAQIAEAQRRAREWKPKSSENTGGRPMK